MTRERKKISQREAVRTRRELRELRRFVASITGRCIAWPRFEVGALNLESHELLRGRYLGAGAFGQPIYLGTLDGNTLHIRAVEVPNAR